MATSASFNMSSARLCASVLRAIPMLYCRTDFARFDREGRRDRCLNSPGYPHRIAWIADRYGEFISPEAEQ
jgi:hypothetical protein